MALIYQFNQHRKLKKVGIEIDSSWDHILDLSHFVKHLIQCSQWNNALTINRQREKYIDQHFLSYPVNAATQTFYQSRLSQLFSLQRELKSLLHKRRQGHLKLVI